jgi:hypothetical protein
VGRKMRSSRELTKAMAVLIRNTTWRCGRVQRLAIDYLRRQFKIFGRARTPIREMLNHFKLKGKRKSEFLDAVERLEKRRIIKIVRLQP